MGEDVGDGIAINKDAWAVPVLQRSGGLSRMHTSSFDVGACAIWLGIRKAA